MLYRGRELDVVSLWGQYVDLPGSLESPLPTYLPKVKCPNPAHDTFKRHFQVNARKPWVHCFGHCGISGSYEHALCVILGIYEQRGITSEEVQLAKTVRTIKEEVATAKARERVGAAHKEARRTIFKNTSLGRLSPIVSTDQRGNRKSVSGASWIAKDEQSLRGGAFQYLPSEARAYLDERGIQASARGKWQLGYDEESERLVIPALDDRGNFAFLIRREIKGNSSLKYLYTNGAIKTSLLFGACMADRERIQSFGIILCEGSIDTIALHQMGQTTAMGILGTGISKKQVRLIDKFSPRRIFLMFDKDLAGIENIRYAQERLTKFPLLVCRYPGGKSDPAELTKEECERSIARAVPIHQFARSARPARGVFV